MNNPLLMNSGAGISGIMMTLLLIFSALLPAIILCVYIYKKDRVEKEPIGLLIKLLIGGATISVVGAIVLGLSFDKYILNPIFDKYILGYNSEGQPVFAETVRHVRDFVQYFFGVGLVEEGVKFLVLVMFTRKNKAFNSLFDGMIYSIFVSLGFAALENVFYVLDNGLVNAVMRGILSVPGHMFFAVMMGYYYSLWHITDKAIEMERSYKAQGLIHAASPEFTSTKYAVLALVGPTLAHGAYDFGLSFGTNLSFLVVILFVIYMYIHCFGKIKKMSASDAPSVDYAYAMILKKYPTLPDVINARNAQLEAQREQTTSEQTTFEN